MANGAPDCVQEPSTVTFGRLEIDEETHGLFRLGLRSHDPRQSLYRLARRLIEHGVGQIDLLRLFSWYQQRVSPEDPSYDAIVDNMDLIHSGPWAKGRELFPSEAGEYESAESPYRDPWIGTTAADSKLEDEAGREIGPDHVLWNRRLRALARRCDCDDVLFAVGDSPQVCVVHLTWSNARERTGFPATLVFPTLLDWCDDQERNGDD
jgi:hypothetical protein